MIILAIETSYKIASVTVKDGEQEITVTADTAKKHAETILPAARDALEQSGYTLHDVDYVAVNIGPGSFTGLRIGICVANALGFALGIPVIPVDSLSIVGEQALTEAAECYAMIDANNGNVYCAHLKADCPKPDVRVEALSEFAAGIGQDDLAAGNVKPEGMAFRMIEQVPNSRSLARFAFRHTELAEKTAQALYVQKSGAERRRKP
ncbi:MAG: tRNA (adenosine(37)-N6)-threonylcarbamoyltransferase complex dimerization subunit type 1 TsaB [Clostridia bacterium]|nr:tRNA (adenosine(37)-N6)-threonylcarbamoyltransferase complex dimerization subunit type 1 TsaB [Clostridia bacterium]